MRLSASWRGAQDRFQGDLALVLRALPADAVVTAAAVTVGPAAGAAAPAGPRFDEVIAFSGSSGDLGATKLAGADFVEIDFHARRTLVSVRGDARLAGSRLLVDVGGLYVEIDARGGILGPDGSPFSLPADGTLPGLTVSRFKLVRINTAAPSEMAVETVTVRSVPSNLSVRLGQMGPFWTRLGEMTTSETSPDFAAVLTGFLLDAAVVNGTFSVPVVVHSDSLARLDVTVNVDYVRDQGLLPGAVSEAVLPFDHGGAAKVDARLLEVALPPGARVVPRGTSGRVLGTFDSTRIVEGQVVPVAPSGAVPVLAGLPFAQPVEMDHPGVAGAIDLMLSALTSRATVSVTFFADADGKPSNQPLLAQPVTIALERAEVTQGPWASAALPVKLALAPGRRVWLVVQSREGEAVWSVSPTSAGPGLQQSPDGGLSWRAAAAAGTSALKAHFRLRDTPATFQMPIEARVGGTGGNGVVPERVPLDRFSPVGRVDFTLDFDDMTGAFNRHLDRASPPPCHEGEQLANGDFALWSDDGDDVPDDWQLTAGGVSALRSGSGLQGALLRDPSREAVTGLSQVVPVSAGCPYRFEFLGLAGAEGAVAEVIWLGPECTATHVDTVAIAADPKNPSSGGTTAGPTTRPVLHRLNPRAPAGADQAEVRFIVPAETYAVIGAVSLSATTDELANGDFRHDGDGELTGWAPATEQMGKDLDIGVVGNVIALRNRGEEDVTLAQRLAVVTGQSYTLELLARVLSPEGQEGTRVELHWNGPASSAVGTPVIERLTARDLDLHVVEGRVPDGVEQVEVRVVVPPETTLGVEHVSFRATDAVRVPLHFIAEAPGELTVLDPRVVFDIADPAPPPVPPSGLCGATAPGATPGSQPNEHCFCRTCGRARRLKEPMNAVTRTGRPAAVGVCATCGTRLVRLGGQLRKGSRVIGQPLAVRSRLQAPANAMTTMVADIRRAQEEARAATGVALEEHQLLVAQRDALLQEKEEAERRVQASEATRDEALARAAEATTRADAEERERVQAELARMKAASARKTTSQQASKLKSEAKTARELRAAAEAEKDRALRRAEEAEERARRAEAQLAETAPEPEETPKDGQPES